MKTLQGWLEFVDRSITAVESAMEARRGTHRVPADDLMAEYMIAEAALCSECIAAAIPTAVHGAWPDLNDEQSFYLLHRLCLARATLIVWREVGDVPPFFPPPTDWRDRAGFLHWLLIDVWNARGLEYLRRWASSAFKFAPSSDEQN